MGLTTLTFTRALHRFVRQPRSDQLWKWAGEYNGISVWVAQPVLPVAVFTQVALLQGLHVQVFCAVLRQRRSRPAQTKTGRRCRTGEALGLREDHVRDSTSQRCNCRTSCPAGDKPFIFITPMPAGASQELPVPGTAGLDIVNADEGCKFHVIRSLCRLTVDAEQLRRAAAVYLALYPSPGRSSDSSCLTALPAGHIPSHNTAQKGAKRGHRCDLQRN